MTLCISQQSTVDILYLGLNFEGQSKLWLIGYTKWKLITQLHLESIGFETNAWETSAQMD